MARRPELGVRLERARVTAGLTLAEAADAIPVSSTSVVDGYEQGRRKPSVAILHRIVDAYTASETYLIAAAGYDPDDATSTPPDYVLLAELIELRGKWIANERGARRRGLANGQAVVVAEAIAALVLALGACATVPALCPVEQLGVECWHEHTESVVAGAWERIGL